MSNELLTLKEVAQRLKTTPRNIWQMISDGRFGPTIYRLGTRSVRVNASEFSDWLDAGLPTKAQWTQKGDSR